MGLDPDCAAIVASMADAPPFEAMTVEQAREMIMGFRPLMGEPEDVAGVEDRSLPGADAPVSVRIYSPATDAPRPAVVYLHGGGWITGDVELTDPLCRMLANRSGCTFVSVDYRLAPEHPFPAALEDAYVATAWLAEHGQEIDVDPGRLAVMGDSSGGNLAAGVTLLARERGGPQIALQVLVYPSVAGNAPDTSSHAEYGEGYIISTTGFAWFWNHYTHGVEPEAGSYAKPLHVEDLRGLPPAYVLTAECDPLRDEGDAYAARLADAGVSVDHRPYPGTMHGFLYMAAAVAKGRQAVDEIATTLREALALQVA